MSPQRLVRDKGESAAEFFERVAATRWDQYISNVEYRAILAAQRHSTQTSTVLDIGAGTGRWSQFLQSLGWRLVCTDVDERALAICQHRIPNAKCILVSENDKMLPGANGSFGMIVCMEVFQVVATSWFLSEATRLLLPGGFLVGVFANRRSARGFVKHMLYVLKGSHGPNYYSTPYPHWRRALQTRGFKLLQEEGLCWLPFSRTSNLPLIGPLVVLERWFGLNRIPALSPWVVFVARKETAVQEIFCSSALGEQPVLSM